LVRWLGVGDELGPRPPDDMEECERACDRHAAPPLPPVSPFFCSGA
jgi:hypothetical protein